MCYFWLMRLLGRYVGSSGCSLGHSVSVVVLSHSWQLVTQRSVAWFGKNGSGDGQWCKVLSPLPQTQFTLCKDHCDVEVLSNGLCFYTSTCFRLWYFNGYSVFLGRQSSLRCVLFALVTPTHNLPVQGSHWPIFLLLFFFSSFQTREGKVGYSCWPRASWTPVEFGVHCNQFKMTQHAAICALIGPFKTCVVAGKGSDVRM